MVECGDSECSAPCGLLRLRGAEWLPEAAPSARLKWIDLEDSCRMAAGCELVTTRVERSTRMRPLAPLGIVTQDGVDRDASDLQ